MTSALGPDHPVLCEAWEALGEDPSLLPWVADGAVPARLPCPLRVGELATASVRVAAAEAALTHAANAGLATDGLPALRTDADRVAVSYSSERVFRWNGEAVNAFAPLSGFWPAADGWVRTHANYPHHRSRLLAVAGLEEAANPGADELAAALLTATAESWEDAAAAAGAVVYAVRSEQVWASHPHAQVVAESPLVGYRSFATDGPTSTTRTGPLPLSGVRVLDLTRVIAGPVATRVLGYLGADVLRVDSPRLPEIEWQYLDGGQGKRSVALDLDTRNDRQAFDALLADADIIVTGYRPGGLDRFGLAADELAVRRPGLVVGQISAWGTTGPWADRRGFDSIVQAVSGIGLTCSADGQRPGALPAQALDHSAGYLLAAGVLSALRRRQVDGLGRHIDVGLARVAHALLALPRPAPEVAPMETAGHVDGANGPAGTVSFAAPAFSYAGGPVAYPWGARLLGDSQPEWAPVE